MSWPGGSCETDSGGRCSGYIDLTVDNPVTFSCPPAVGTDTNDVRTADYPPQKPCVTNYNLNYSFLCNSGYEQVQTQYPSDRYVHGASGNFLCVSDRLIVTVAGQAVPVTSAPGAQHWTGCGSLPALPAVDWTNPSVFGHGGCGGSAVVPFINRPLPFFVEFDRFCVVTITAPFCIHHTGFGQGINTLVQSYLYVAQTPAYGEYATCDPMTGIGWPSADWCNQPQNQGLCLYGETTATNCATFYQPTAVLDSDGNPDTGDDFCEPFATTGTIPPTVPGWPAYYPPNPFAGPVTVTEAGGRSGGRQGGATPRTGPSLARRALNLAQAVATHVGHGMPMADPNTTRARLAICESCLPPDGYFNPARRSCARPECGCNMDIKASWADMKCPVGKWDAVAAAPAAG